MTSEVEFEEPDISKFTKWKQSHIVSSGQLIGTGQHGYVYRITIGYLFWKETFAVKLIKLSNVHSNFVQHMLHLSSISRKYKTLVDIVCVWSDKTYVYIWMEPCLNNLLNLMEQLQKPDSLSYFSAFSRILCKGDPKMVNLLHHTKQIAQGLADLHNESVIHGNLKPENILLAGKSLKHADFSIFESTNPIYKAPEVINDGKYGFESDVYALGKIFTDLLDIIDDCRKKTAVEQLTKQMKSKQPDKRPSMAEVVEKLSSIEKMWF